MGIPIGSQLTFEGDGETTVTVIDERQVTLNDTPYSLTGATRTLKGLDYSIQPTPHWRYQGRLVQDIYNETYPAAAL